MKEEKELTTIGYILFSELVSALKNYGENMMDIYERITRRIGETPLSYNSAMSKIKRIDRYCDLYYQLNNDEKIDMAKKMRYTKYLSVIEGLCEKMVNECVDGEEIEDEVSFFYQENLIYKIKHFCEDKNDGVIDPACMVDIKHWFDISACVTNTESGEILYVIDCSEFEQPAFY